MPICVEKIILQFPIRKSIFQLVISPLHHHFNQRPLSYGERYGRQVRGFGLAAPASCFRRWCAANGCTTFCRVEGPQENELALLDPDSFIEIDALVSHRNREGNMHMHPQFGDGVVAGHGTVDGRRVFCFSQDFTVFGGSMGEMHANKICKVLEMAERARVPIVCIWDGGGQRAHDGVHSLAATGVMLDYFVACSGRVPIISVVLGPVVGVSALAAGLADFVILGEENGQLFLSSPLETEETASGEMTNEEVGGAQMHASRSGVCCLTATDEDDAMEIAIELLSFFPITVAQAHLSSILETLPIEIAQNFPVSYPTIVTDPMT